MKVQKLAVAMLFAAVVVPGTALAQDRGFEPERRALFISILENNGCKFHNLAPDPTTMKQIEANDFLRDELRAIVFDILESGDGVREGELLVLQTDECV
ncbi:hypothetical protein G5B40_01535 [Pikeienuella piscinae]|uniref:Uncharacterized protein n=1 Tax=Pikeienuella piscinae TaxID=2748098 RepID=A0A7L5BUW7_9RHOB|nr:hypothetical protein [Pikeienuella piscinae]QIE54237.1 hypothetical protein G5B40_01535 [Pikeienuella piscinae]